MGNIKRDPRGQGERGEQLAALWFESHGVPVFVPVSHNPRDFDFIVEWGEGVQRIQVKTSTQFRNDRWDVSVCTRGGNRSWSGLSSISIGPDTNTCSSSWPTGDSG